MTLELTDWDNDLSSEADEEYQALLRTLNLTEGFGLFFVRCSPPVETERLIGRVKKDIFDKNIEVLRLKKPVNNLYDLVEELDKKTK